MVSYSFLVNDSAFGNVIVQQRIRQGKPALMYIFILYGEVLSGLCRQAQESGLMTGIKLARHFMVHPNTTRLSVSSHSTRKVLQECAFWLSRLCSPSASHGCQDWENGNSTICGKKPGYPRCNIPSCDM